MVLQQASLRDRFATGPQSRTESLESWHMQVCVRTVQPRLNELGLRARKPGENQIFTKGMREEGWIGQWKTWLDCGRLEACGDESKFNLLKSDSPSPVRRRREEKFDPQCAVRTARHCPTVMIWGCITSKRIGRFSFLRSIANTEKYKKIIGDCVAPTVEAQHQHFDEVMLQDDVSKRNFYHVKFFICFKSTLPWRGNEDR